MAEYLTPEIMYYVELVRPFLVAGITLFFGLCYFIMPKSSLSLAGIEGTEAHPEGIGDGRSTFAGFAIGLPVIIILFQQPILFQILTIAWTIIAAGRLLQLLIDGGFRERVTLNLLKLVIASSLAAWSYFETGLPDSVLNPVFSMPETLKLQVPAISAGITVLFGIIAFLLPRTALAIVRMRPKEGLTSPKGEPRGMMAGMYLAVGGMALLHNDVLSVPGVFIGVVLSCCWFITAFGRMIAILSDRCNNLFNWVSLACELALGALPLIVILDLVAL